jgi:hypothetical protein
MMNQEHEYQQSAENCSVCNSVHHIKTVSLWLMPVSLIEVILQ